MERDLPVVGDDRDLTFGDDVDLLERGGVPLYAAGGRKCERPTLKFLASDASKPCNRSAVQSECFGAW